MHLCWIKFLLILNFWTVMYLHSLDKQTDNQLFTDLNELETAATPSMSEWVVISEQIIQTSLVNWINWFIENNWLKKNVLFNCTPLLLWNVKIFSEKCESVPHTNLSYYFSSSLDHFYNISVILKLDRPNPHSPPLYGKFDIRKKKSHISLTRGWVNNDGIFIFGWTITLKRRDWWTESRKRDRKTEKDKAKEISIENEPVCSLSKHIGYRNILFLFHTLVLFFPLTLLLVCSLCCHRFCFLCPKYEYFRAKKLKGNNEMAWS